MIWLENEITEINEKLSETIYTPFQNGRFLTCSDCIQQLSENNYPTKKR